MSKYTPYASFKQYSITYKRTEHREKFQLRKKRLLYLFKKSARLCPGIKIDSKKLESLYQEHLRKRGEKEPKKLTRTGIIDLAHDLRLDGEPICSDSTGYWYSRDPNDIAATIIGLEEKAYGIFYTVSKLDKHLNKISPKDRSTLFEDAKGMIEDKENAKKQQERIKQKARRDRLKAEQAARTRKGDH